MSNNRVFFYINSHTHLLDLAGAVQTFNEAVNYGIHYDLCFISDQPSQTSSANLGFSHLELFSNVVIASCNFFRRSCTVHNALLEGPINRPVTA